jgi:hypothetical protein
MTPLHAGWRWLAEEPRHRIGIRVLQTAIGLMLLFRVLTEMPFAPYLWGPNGVASGSSQYILGPLFGGPIDRLFATDAGVYLALAALAAGAVGLVLGRWTRAATLVAIVMFCAFEQRLPEMGDGGDNIARLALIYSLFTLPPARHPARGSLSVWVHNVAVLAIITQVVILYATSGLMKAYGDKWHHGVAMYYVSQVQWFSLPAMREMFKNPLVATCSTYVPMLYQVAFPMAMLSRLKLPWLFVGMLFHLGVAVFMGLVTFSTVMIGLELYLISDPEYAWLADRVLAMKHALVFGAPVRDIGSVGASAPQATSPGNSV